MKTNKSKQKHELNYTDACSLFDCHESTGFYGEWNYLTVDQYNEIMDHFNIKRMDMSDVPFSDVI